MEERARSQPKLTQHKTKQKGGCERTVQKLPLLHSWPGGVHQIPVAHSHNQTKPGGESGIRTRGTLSSTHALQACTFNHSVISPDAKLWRSGRSIGCANPPRCFAWQRGRPLGAAWSTKLKNMAEREGFEPPVPLRVHLISNQTQSTSSAISPENTSQVMWTVRKEARAYVGTFAGVRRARKKAVSIAPHSSASTPAVTATR